MSSESLVFVLSFLYNTPGKLSYLSRPPTGGRARELGESRLGWRDRLREPERLDLKEEEEEYWPHLILQKFLWGKV